MAHRALNLAIVACVAGGSLIVSAEQSAVAPRQTTETYDKGLHAGPLLYPDEPGVLIGHGRLRPESDQCAREHARSVVLSAAEGALMWDDDVGLDHRSLRDTVVATASQ